MSDELITTEDQRLPLVIPDPREPTLAREWKLVALNKKVLNGWVLLLRQIPGNCQRCFEWLSSHPKKPIPRRCYALRGKAYAGSWGYEIGSGERVYYTPRSDNTVLIYYAGTHPTDIPYPPETDE